ncbi:hypothetical protein KUTeg_009456 [Tegillarca granosa]|uniref:Nose resistant-to-fluoxetine protein N-terminal domain-containing protein n=1 Tax=Tegillarca granosa TaxID=220873 RepID=A0ABQ9F3W8_TEGGR|nr:hypothetical protein KUTeg_009456 [Tegillarca granosa]
MKTGFGHYAQRVVLPLKHDEWTKTDAIQSDIQQLRSLLKNGIFEFLQIYSEPRNAFDFNVSKICFNDTLKISSNPYSNYSQRMIDADFKIPSGVLDGNIRWLGSYDQCVSDKTHLSLQGQRFSSKYCLVSFPISKSLVTSCYKRNHLDSDILSLVNISASHSVCVEEKPFTTEKICGGPDRNLQSFGCHIYIFQSYPVYQKLELLAACKKTNVNCGEEQYTERTGLLSGTTSTSYTKSVSVAIKEVPKGENICTERTGLLFRTTNTFYTESFLYVSERYLICRIIMAFSIITNTKKLMNTSTANSPLACLNGMRVISMWWIILGHTYSFVIFFLGLSFGNQFKKVFLERNVIKNLIVPISKTIKQYQTTN